MTELSNWGRWGSSDERGTLNLITPEKRKRAAALVKTGTVVRLGHDLLTEKGADSPVPYELDVRPLIASSIAVERQDISPHGRAFSHIDALCHVGTLDGRVYNGFPFKEVVTKEGGCTRLGISDVNIVTRGVLLDIPRLKQLPYLEPGTHVYREDIEAWERRAGIKVSSGDALLLRTGRWARRAKTGGFLDQAGYDPSFVPFLKERGVAVLGGDADQDGGSTVPGFPNAIHRIALAALGMHILDNLDLEALAESAAKLQRWEFLLIVTPAPVKGGSGSPINPVAIF
jgi:kynurenine formamidase